jgi:hypothetical protein
MNIRFFLLCLCIFFGGILSIFSWSAYGYYKEIQKDAPGEPTVTVQLGNTTIIREDLAIDLVLEESYNLEE